MEEVKRIREEGEKKAGSKIEKEREKERGRGEGERAE